VARARYERAGGSASDVSNGYSCTSNKFRESTHSRAGLLIAPPAQNQKESVIIDVSSEAAEKLFDKKKR